MKELFVGFLIALAVGSMWNQFNGADSGANSVSSSGQSGTSSGGNNSAAGGGGNVATTQQAIAGQELVVDIDEGSFQGYVLDAREPVLVEFYTDNCPHCVKMAPILGQLAYNGQGIIRICKINASNSASLSERYDVSGVPSFALFSEGHVVDSTSGAHTFEGMRGWLSQNNISIPETGSQNPTM